MTGPPSVSDGGSDTTAEAAIELDYSGYLSPEPENDRIAAARDERRYRMVLQHEFHPSRASLCPGLPPCALALSTWFCAVQLPLWSPSPVRLGSVGYLDKPSGRFVTLFDALDPARSSGGAMTDAPSVHGYGRVNMGAQRLDKRNSAQRGLDIIQSWLHKNSPGPAS